MRQRATADRIAALDGVRGLSCVFILFQHNFKIAVAAALFPVAAAIKDVGWLSVDLFFVLSGFLITRVLLGLQADPHYYRNFFARRVSRLFPLYYLVVFALMILMMVETGAFRPILRHFLPFLTHTSNFAMALHGNHYGGMLGVAWTLSLEEQFYLLWPWLLRKLKAATLMRACLVVMVLMPPLRLLILLKMSLVAASILARLDAIALGVLLALMEVTPLPAWLRRFPPVLTVVAAAVGLTLCIVYTERIGLVLSVFSPLVLPGMAWLVWRAATPEKGPAPLMRFFSQRWLVLVGRYSYGMYLLHHYSPLSAGKVLSGWLGRHGIDPLASLPAVGIFVVDSLGVFLLAALSFHFFETPVRRWLTVRLEKTGPRGAVAGKDVQVDRPGDTVDATPVGELPEYPRAVLRK